ncbi:phosphotransferase family protein [Mycolicibacterium palauense]|uniref:phosphotransferase family protein n=1 Tax=Mycolicibacterium palauense TaxID=2034511 RepID=UPI000BFECC72|nr:phosphotransferase family protein [Mycolicibacterium palauense]
MWGIGISDDALADWLRERGIDGDVVTDARILTGGTQNRLVRFTFGGRNLVLRRPPDQARDHSSAVNLREARILEALSSSTVPHPRLVAANDDIARFGTAFYVTDEVDGFCPAAGMPEPHRSTPHLRREMGLEAARVAATLSTVDIDELNLGDLGSRADYLQRQVERTAARMERVRISPSYRGELAVDPLIEWLYANVPQRWVAGLRHGDLHLGNMMFSRQDGSLAALIDWEQATMGDPLMDLGWLLVTWPGPGRVNTPTLVIEPWDGFPTADELVGEYAQHSDRGVDDLPWFEVIAGIQLAVLLEGTYLRSLEGKVPKPLGMEMHRTAEKLVDFVGRRAG